MSDDWADNWELRRDCGRALGGQHLGPRVVRPESNRLPMICEHCGSPDVREVERVARSGYPESVSWWCIDCGAEQPHD